MQNHIRNCELNRQNDRVRQLSWLLQFVVFYFIIFLHSVFSFVQTKKKRKKMYNFTRNQKEKPLFCLSLLLVDASFSFCFVFYFGLHKWCHRYMLDFWLVCFTSLNHFSQSSHLLLLPLYLFVDTFYLAVAFRFQYFHVFFFLLLREWLFNFASQQTANIYLILFYFIFVDIVFEHQFSISCVLFIPFSICHFIFSIVLWLECFSLLILPFSLLFFVDIVIYAEEPNVSGSQTIYEQGKIQCIFFGKKSKSKHRRERTIVAYVYQSSNGI